MFEALTVLLLFAGWTGSRLETQNSPPEYRELLLAANREWPVAVVADFRRAVAGLPSDKPSAAARTFERTAGVMPGFSDWALLLAARAAAAAGDTAAVRTSLRGTEASLAADHGWRHEVAGFLTAGDTAGAVRALDRRLPAVRNNTARADAAVRLGGLQLHLADSSGAVAAFRLAMAADPTTPAAAQAAAAMARIRQTRPEDRLEAARVLARHGRADAALAQLDRHFRQTDVPAQERYTLRLGLARSLFEAGQFTAVEQSLLRLVRDSADTPSVAEAMGLLGRAQVRLSRKDIARATLARAVAMPSASAEALFFHADDAHDRGDFAVAVPLYDRLILEWPESGLTAEAAVRLGGLHFAAGRFRESAAVFERLRTHPLDPEVGARLNYWRGLRFAGQLPVLYALAEELHEHGHLVEAVRMGRSIRRAGGAWNLRLLRIVYPLPFRSEIVAARSRGIDPFLVAGLIRQESLFEPTARSRAGAVGLMQILPATGRSLALKDGLRPFAPGMLVDPGTNVRLGTLFVADLLRQNQGSIPFALAAYNAGPGRLKAWKARPEASDPDAFTERIPFAETRNYVRTVQQNARIYAQLYAEEIDLR